MAADGVIIGRNRAYIAKPIELKRRIIIEGARTMNQSVQEADWRIFRELHEKALERFCKRVLGEIDLVSQDGSRTNRDRYCDIFQLMKERDRELARAFDDFRRSTMRLQVTIIASLGLLEPDELARFTPELQESISAALDPKHGIFA